MSEFEKIYKPAINGFPTYVHQIVTDDCFTLIDLLPTSEGSGWNVRVWKRNLAALIKTGTFYDPAPFIALSPLSDITFKRPSATAGNNTLLYVVKENTGSSIRTITNEAAQILNANNKRTSLVSKVYLGNGTAGPLLSEEKLTYSARGSKLWDYTITREVSVAAIDEAGTAGDLVLIAKSLENYDDYSLAPTAGGARGMKRLMTRTDAYQISGQVPQTTTYAYVSSPSNIKTHGNLKSQVNPDGTWSYHEYPLFSLSGSTVQSIDSESWKDVTMTNRTAARITTHETVANTSTSTTRIGGQLISQKKVTVATLPAAQAGSALLFLPLQANQIPSLPISTEQVFDGSNYHTTSTLYHADSSPSPLNGRIVWVENSDGTAITYSYAIDNQNLVVTKREGAGNRNGIHAGIETITTFSSGNHAIAETQKDISTNLSLYSWVTDVSYNGGTDALGRPIKRIFNGDVNDYDIAQYACCGLAFARKRDGSSVEYFRDGLKRVYMTVSKTSAASPAVTDFTTVNGLTNTHTRKIGNGSSFFVRSTTVSLDGLSSAVTHPSKKSNLATDRPTTSTVIVRGAGSTGDTTTTTFADLSTLIRGHFLDGQLKSVSGSAEPDVSYEYATHDESGGGLKWITTASGVVTTTFTDLLNRKAKILSTAYGSSSMLYHYYPLNAIAGSRAKLQSTTDPDGVVTIYGYNAKGESATQSRTVPLASGSSTQVITMATDYVPDITLHGYQLGVSRVKSQTLSGTGAPATTVLKNYTAVDGRSSGSTSLAGHILTVVSWPDAAGISTSTTTRPDGTKTLQHFQHGLLSFVATLDTAGLEMFKTSYTYTPFQQPSTSTDLRTGTTTYTALTESGQVLSATAPNNLTTTFAYDVMGRRIMVDAPDTLDANNATLTNISHTAYHPTGDIKATWGSQTYPTWNGYDEQGRQTQLHTWKIAPTLTQTTAAPPAGSEITTWFYGPTTGRLDRKQYADTKGTNYTYTAAGRLQTRTWTRTASGSENRVTTTYGYTYGIMTSADYSDSTPDVTIIYEPLGRQESVSTSVAKSEFTYDPATLAVDTETISYNLDTAAGYEFFRVLDRKPTSLGRDTGWQLKADSTIENEVAYGYHPTDGRLSQVSNPQISNLSFSYGYVPNSNLLETVTGPIHTVTNIWEPQRDVLDIKQNKVGTDVVSKYDYLVNGIGQRTEVSTSGTAFPALPSWLWGYDSLGQVISADSSVGTSDRAYEYDAIGNRKKSATSLMLPATDNYATNALNQYTLTAASAVTPMHDFDGNMTSGPLPAAPTTNSTLVWDAENRLSSTTVGNVTTTTLFDAKSRRIAKTTGGNTTIYLYDGWNCIAEYRLQNSSFSLHTSRIWGSDLSGTLQGAGGVGGLLGESQISNSQVSAFFPTYDGNGNVSEYLASNGSIAAHFEYDPFGNTAINTDSGNLFNHRFSTKPIDQETGLYYYGYRYYDSLTGRWPSRDPIGERGGVNLYQMVGNNAIGKLDSLGLFGFEGMPQPPPTLPPGFFDDTPIPGVPPNAPSLPPVGEDPFLDALDPEGAVDPNVIGTCEYTCTLTSSPDAEVCTYGNCNLVGGTAQSRCPLQNNNTSNIDLGPGTSTDCCDPSASFTADVEGGGDGGRGQLIP